jgi:hypothetical protein
MTKQLTKLLIFGLLGFSLYGQTINGVPVSSTGIELTANKDAASGYAGLTAGTLLKTAEMPAFTGDATTVAGNVAITVAKVNGTTVPVNSAADQVLLTTASATGSWGSIGSCSGTGQALQYNTSTHVFACVTLGVDGSGTASHLAYYAATGSTIADAGADFTYDGTHTWSMGASGILDLHAAAVANVKLPGASTTGLVRVTTTTGAIGSAELSGDATTNASNAVTVAKINGTSVPTNSAADQFLGTTASATGAWASITNCLDSAGNHLNYNTSTHTFSCGTTSSAAGTVTSVSGTANQITSSGTSTPTLSLPATVLFPGIYQDKVNAVSFSATPAFDLSAGNTITITLTGNVTASTITNHVSGERVNFLVCQNGTGGYTFAWPTTVKGAPTVGTTLSTCTSASFIDNGTNLYATGIGNVNM